MSTVRFANYKTGQQRQVADITSSLYSNECYRIAANKAGGFRETLFDANSMEVNAIRFPFTAVMNAATTEAVLEAEVKRLLGKGEEKL